MRQRVSQDLEPTRSRENSLRDQALRVQLLSKAFYSKGKPKEAYAAALSAGYHSEEEVQVPILFKWLYRKVQL